MRIKRSLPIVLGVVAIAISVALVVELRKHAPPEAARLLPGADVFVYVNLKWVRTVAAIGQLPPVSHEPDYEQFIQQTGFQFERDLDEAAFAVHYPGNAGTVAAGSSQQPHFSEVFVGRFQVERLRAYLQQKSKSLDTYRATEIFNIPLEGRTVRVAILGVDTVAVSNLDDQLVIRGMVDRSRKLASPFGGPALLRQYYKQVPIASLAWAIAKVGPRTGLPSGFWATIFPRAAMLVVSARFLRALHLRAEAFTGSADDATAIADKVGTYLNLFHSAENAVSPRGGDPDVKAFFDSLRVSQQHDRAVLTAIMPGGFIHKIFVEAPQQIGAPPTGEKPSEPAEQAKPEKQSRSAPK